jgi:translocation and assembly module TamB
VAEQAPLAGRVQANLPRIGVWSVLAPPGWRLRGSLVADVQVGARARTGPLRLRAGRAARAALRGRRHRAAQRPPARAAGGRRLVVNEFMLQGSPDGSGDGGRLVAQGEGSWTPQGPRFEAEAQLSRLRASVRSDRQLTVSGTVAARVDRSATQSRRPARGPARIIIPDESPPRLAEDVVVAMRRASRRPRRSAGRSRRPTPTRSWTCT